MKEIRQPKNNRSQDMVKPDTGNSSLPSQEASRSNFEHELFRNGTFEFNLKKMLLQLANNWKKLDNGYLDRGTKQMLLKALQTIGKKHSMNLCGSSVLAVAYQNIGGYLE